MPVNKISHNSGMAQLPLAISGKQFTTMKKALFHGRLRVFGEKMNTSVYRLSHAIVYINYDGYATYSMTFKPKAKVGLMTAGWTSCFHDGMPLAFFC